MSSPAGRCGRVGIVRRGAAARGRERDLLVLTEDVELGG